MGDGRGVCACGRKLRAWGRNGGDKGFVVTPFQVSPYVQSSKSGAVGEGSLCARFVVAVVVVVVFVSVLQPPKQHSPYIPPP